MWVLASGVAAIAAVVSYSHIYELGRAHAGTGAADTLAACLLPLSVDMLILAGELMLLHETDGRGRRFVLGWVLVWSGIGATLAANVAYGAQFGVVGALIWGWPAYSFILAAGGMVAVVKRSSARAGGERTGPDRQVGRTGPETAQPQAAAPVGVSVPVSARRPRKPARLTAEERALKLMAGDPSLRGPRMGGELARRMGVSPATGRRLHARLTAHT